MKLIPIAAVVAALVVVPPAFAQQKAPANKVDCEKAKMKWDDKGGKGSCTAAASTPAKSSEPAKK